MSSATKNLHISCRESEQRKGQKMLEVIGKNFSNAEVLDGKTIRMHIKENSTNKEMINKISETITNKNTYDVSINFSNDGYVESIDITIYDRNKSK